MSIHNRVRKLAKKHNWCVDEVIDVYEAIFMPGEVPIEVRPSGSEFRASTRMESIMKIFESNPTKVYDSATISSLERISPNYATGILCKLRRKGLIEKVHIGKFKLVVIE